jgi:hypothetical protein
VRKRSGFSAFAGGGKKFRDAESIESVEILLLRYECAVGTLSERFANGLSGARGTGAQRDHLATVFFLELQRFFERVGVRLVDLEAQVGFLDPASGGFHAELRVADGDLLNRNNYFHDGSASVTLENEAAIRCRRSRRS